MSESRDDGVDALYALPLNEFVAARNALAKERKDPELKKLAKPSATAWALNQLARQHVDELEAFLRAASKVAETQAGAVQGRGSAPFKEAVQAERDALAPLVAAARKLVNGEPAVLKVTDALRAAGSDPALHDALRAGRFSEEPELGGFGGLAGLDGSAIGPDEDDDAERIAEEAARAERLRREREHEAEQAEREAVRLEARAEDAEARARQLRAEADAARERADDLRTGM